MAVLGELGSSTSAQLSGPPLTLLVPVGSTEQHGPHLPLDTDTRIAAAVAQQAVARLVEDRSVEDRLVEDQSAEGRSVGDRSAGDRSAGPAAEWQWLVAPAICYGASGEHQSFPGTVSIGTDALTTLLLEYGRSACCWAQRVVFVNGHGGNVAALAAAVGRLRFEQRDVAWWPCAVAGADAHAGHTETSLLLHISPIDVLTDRLSPGNCAPLAELLPALRRGGVAAVSERGVLGDPTTATAADGRRIFAELVDGCVRATRDWAPGDDGMLR